MEIDKNRASHNQSNWKLSAWFDLYSCCSACYDIINVCIAQLTAVMSGGGTTQ